MTDDDLEGINYVYEEYDGEDDAANPELSDEDWLATLPFRQSLNRRCLARFDAEALAFRRTLPARQAYREACRKEINKAKREGKGTGPWIRFHERYLSRSDPSRWDLCPDCLGHGYKSVLNHDVLAWRQCETCKGNGYRA